jgi:hypothetical protein
MLKALKTNCIFFLLIGPLFQPVFGQATDEELSAVILQKDSLFWSAYNTCNTYQFVGFFTNDVEFYHDKGGKILGLENLEGTMKKNLCGSNNFRLRREAIYGSLKVFPLRNSNVIYGAILSGEHVFYVIEPGTKERLDGQARFSHLWLLKDGTWKMSRILSYDHGPAKALNQKKEIALSNNILQQYPGKYQGAQSGIMTISQKDNLLLLSIQDKTMSLHPEKENLFFVVGRDLTFEFIKNDKNKIYKMLVRENGKLVEETVLLNK